MLEYMQQEKQGKEYSQRISTPVNGDLLRNYSVRVRRAREH